ncbi:Dynamin [Penicillium bovifimosum]|uniref:Dynamin n=1 Tax=Penicillium bovifimosum TaxID=126998 RepID=A0A9W9KX70_9EURO|nr:Dynamin [Penicillium bovifimosum]KAJ5124287.1 Dynamin [Penicillium bovifimosum]
MIAKEVESITLSDPGLLEKIDQLFACNVGEYVDLPQLVVVGDQSSGKSSVLEGLTKLNFPRDSGLCTRFATQIIFRRNVNLVGREISASIIPAPDLGTDEAQKLRDWNATGLQALGGEGFAQMMREIGDLQVIGSFGKATFSNSVLRLEISGPQEDHLSVVDVPGIFKTTINGITTKDDIVLVRNMVYNYMKNPRSVVLTVVPANVDIATQEIIEIAREIDPTGERTLQIMTKIDLNTSGKLGWIIVRNLGQQELEDGNVDRDLLEKKWHQTPPWNRVRAENFGINALGKQLQLVLTSHVRRTFPSVRSESTKRLNAARKALQSLGTERQTPEQQRMTLLDIVSSFQQITHLALVANYSLDDIFDTDRDVRLATMVSSRNEEFSNHVSTWGHEFAFTDTSQTDPLPDPLPEPKEPEGSKGSEESAGSSEEFAAEIEPAKQCGVDFIPSRGIQADEEVQEILHDAVNAPRAKDGISIWMGTVYRESRGFEIGTFNHTLLSALMKKQSAKWSTLAQGYMSDVITMVHRFIKKALLAACGDIRISTNVLTHLWDELIGKYRQAILHVDFLLKIERGGTPMTLNHYLNDNLQKCRQKRFKEALASKKWKCNCNYCSQHGEVVRVSDLSYCDNMSNVEHTVHDLHDILQAYYKVARKRFVDNVCMQGADYFLVTGPEAPMKLFSSSWVNGLSDKALEEIAGEGGNTKRRRLQLQKEIADLEVGRKILLN